VTPILRPLLLGFALCSALACGSSVTDGSPGLGAGGAAGSGGSANGAGGSAGTTAGGSLGGGGGPTGGAGGSGGSGVPAGTAGGPTAGAPSGGSASGGSASGGSASGGSASGGSASGGSASGGSASGGSASGGSASGGSASGGSGPFPEGVTKPRLMIVGDSISAGPGCYKKYLQQSLTESRYTRLEFVGQYTDDCGGGVRHSAVSCSTAEQYTQATFTMPNCSQGKSFPGLATLMTAHRPDLLMLQLGVNDVWNGRPTAEILGSYRQLVEQARAQNPRIVLAIAQIQKIRPDCSSDDTVQKRAEALVMAVPAWAAQLSSAQSPIFVADLWTNSDFSKAETEDCVHPNDVGARRMASNWLATLKLILKPD
jgi:GDSL-like Lipase/Acylhydrolase family